MLTTGKADVKPEAARIISDIRTLKAGALMYRLDNGSIEKGTDISVLEPYTSAGALGNDDISFSFETIGGQTYLKVDLSGVEVQVKEKIVEMVEEGEFSQPQVFLPFYKGISDFAFNSGENIISLFIAKPAYAKSDKGKGKGNGNGNGNGYGNSNGEGTSNNNDNGNDNTTTTEDLESYDGGDVILIRI